MELSLRRLLRTAVEQHASDVHVQAGSPPMLRLDGRVRYVEAPAMTPEQCRAFAAEMLGQDDYAARVLNQEGSCDLSYQLDAAARFRVNLFNQRDTVALAFRRVYADIPSIRELNLPPTLETIAQTQRGLVLVTGTTSSGKSTTIATMLDYINQHYDRRIITIEDPIEFVHRSKRSLVAQIEVGRDTRDYETAIMHVLRQDPDVLMVGELRDLASVRVALRAADTGHLVFATVHATNVQQTAERIVAMFDPAQEKLLLTQLALNLEAIIAQRLANARQGGRLPVCEILRGTPTVRKLVFESRFGALAQAVANRDAGMQTFDQHLEGLYRARLISADETLKLASHREALTMALRGVKTGEMTQGLVR